MTYFLNGLFNYKLILLFSKASQLAEETESAGKDVFGFKTPKKSGSMVLKAQEELNRTPRSARNTPNFNPSSPRTPRTGSRTTTPSKVRVYGQYSSLCFHLTPIHPFC